MVVVRASRIGNAATQGRVHEGNQTSLILDKPSTSPFGRAMTPERFPSAADLGG